MISLRTYQENALSKLGTTGEQVLSICPGGGKTFTAIEYINRNFKDKRTLILAHGTNVLKNQWYEELKKLQIEFSTDVESNSNIVLSIPQAIKGRGKNKFDLIIVDEAHEFYFAEMVKTIIQRFNPSCCLLLTGTPSKFIKNGFTPVIVSGVEVYSEGYLTDTYFGVVKSSYKLKLDDFTEDGETNESFKFNVVETKQSLKSLVKEMLKRLKATDFLKSHPNVNNALNMVKLNDFQKAFDSLDKTMIAARNIAQAKFIAETLLENGVPAVISTEEDNKNTEIHKFLNDKEVKVLVVVRKGILGFNMPELVNVVDFTMSRNIDRIYQLYARVLRKHPGLKKKFFFRLCSALNPSVDTYYLQAAMCLNNPDFICKYNGKNLKLMEVLVRKSKNKQSKTDVKINKNRKNTKNVPIDEIMADQILSLELLQELRVNSDSKYWKEFGYMQFGKVIEKLTGKVFHREIVNITEENLLWMIKHGKVDERIYG